MRFRPFSASMMNNPLAEAGDICIITDRKGNQYKSLVTSTIFQVGNKQTIECGAKSAARNSAKQYSLASQAIVENRKNLQKERSDREKALEELSNIGFSLISSHFFSSGNTIPVGDIAKPTYMAISAPSKS